MASKAPFILVLIGAIVGFINGVVGLVQYFTFKALGTGPLAEMSGELAGESAEIFNAAMQGVLLWALISSIIGIVLALVLIMYIIRFKNGPSKNDCIVTLVLGIVGIFLGLGLIAGVLLIIGAAIGLSNLKKSGSAPKAKPAK